jgi:hypothetical protein
MSTWDEPWGLVRAHLSARKGVQAFRREGLELKKARRAAKSPFLLSPQLQLVLPNPEERLIVYGTLVPGGRFHHLLANLAAHWERSPSGGAWAPTGATPPSNGTLQESPTLPGW